MLGDQTLHRLHRLFGPPQLVVRAGLLIQHLVVVLVGRILREQLIVERDRLQRSGRRQLLRAAGRRDREPIAVRGNRVLRGRTTFEILLRFRQVGDASRLGRLRPDVSILRSDLANLRLRQGHRSRLVRLRF